MGICGLYSRETIHNWLIISYPFLPKIPKITFKLLFPLLHNVCAEHNAALNCCNLPVYDPYFSTSCIPYAYQKDF